MSDHADYFYDKWQDTEAKLEAAEARVTELEAALSEIAQPMPETDGDWGSTYDWEKSAKARRDIARAALAKEDTDE